MTKTKTTPTKKAAKATTKKAAAAQVEAPLGNPQGIELVSGTAPAKKAAKPAKKAAKAPKAPKAESTALAIHINKTGRVCFGKVAAERIGRLAYMVMTADGPKVRMHATDKEVEGAVYINRANGRPYVSATKLLKATGKFDGTKALDITAAAYNSHGFEFQVA